MITVNIHESFRDLNVIISTSKGIADLYNIKDSKVADKIMWSIFMIEYPDKDKNPKASMSFEEAVQDIKNSYYSNLDLDDIAVKEARNSFKKYCLTFEERMYAIQKSKLNQGTMFFDELNLSSDDDFDKYIKMSDKLGKIWSNFDTIKNQYLNKKQSNNSIMGEGLLPRSEQRRQNRQKS